MSDSPPPLRVLQLNSLLTGGGTDDQCVKLAGELHRLGQHVCLAGPAGSAFAPLIAQRSVRFLDTGPRGHRIQFIRRAAGIIRAEKIQIVHGHHGRDFWPVVLAARLAGTGPKIVLTRHLAKSPGSWAGRHWLLDRCDSMMAVSEFVAKVLKEGAYEPQSPEAERRARPPLLGDLSKIRVIPGGIDTELFRPADATDKRRELGLGSGQYAFAVVGGFDLPRGKGQREFLAAAALAREKIPHARFLIIGRGSMEEILKADIARLGLEGAARLTGQVSDMPHVMNAIDCLVHPQIGTEALGLVVCEAHACGKPVIASALDGIPEAFAAANFGHLVTPENIEELATAMIRQASQPGLSPDRAQKLNRQVAETFSIEQMGEKTLRLYRELLAI